MPIDSKFYIHPSDKAAMAALKAIPGFAPLMKAFMSVWNERLNKIENMSTNLRVSEKQMSKYYNMLPPICEKLGIAIPELYIKMDVQPNAYTFGDTNPFIVVTSGLIERFSDELIETVLAHECGHIACHHTLLRTVGYYMFNNVGLWGKNIPILTESLRIAFYYWMRCSEFSADRAAVVYDDGADKITRMCMQFAGYDPRYCDEADVEEFMNQAKEYKEMTDTSKVNKLMEFYQFCYLDHPLTAVRAYEAAKWAESEDFDRIFGYITAVGSSDTEGAEEETEGEGGAFAEGQKIPVPDSSANLRGKDYKEVEKLFRDFGFTNITCFDQDSKELFRKSGAVLEVSIDGDENFLEDAWFSADAPISIRYKK